MAKKLIPTCPFKGCKRSRQKAGDSWNKFCSSHAKKANMNGFLGTLYSQMDKRVKGKVHGFTAKRVEHLYLGLPILPRDAFLNWAKNHPDFLALYKRWFSNDFDRKLTPSVNRMNSNKGYVLGNIEWMTTSQNCALSSEVRKMKQKKEIYNLLGVNK